MDSGTMIESWGSWTERVYRGLAIPYQPTRVEYQPDSAGRLRRVLVPFGLPAPEAHRLGPVRSYALIVAAKIMDESGTNTVTTMDIGQFTGQPQSTCSKTLGDLVAMQWLIFEQDGATSLKHYTIIGG